ncbi:MAG: LptA/OstA family protein, partial [Plesiomonas shigelloides]
MHIRYILALGLFPQLALADEAVLAPEQDQCLVLPPVPQLAPIEYGLTPMQQVEIRSNRSDAIMDKSAVFEGEVKFRQGNRAISADRATMDYEQQLLDAEGNLIFQEDAFTVTADKLSARIKDNTAKLEGAQYWIHGQQIHGDANQL